MQGREEEAADRLARWSDPERVAQFADREPDLRLRAILDELAEGTTIRALDLGCAGGRNTELMAERGVDVVALDLSPAMVERTRERVTRILGKGEARRRVVEGQMVDLSVLPIGDFDLIVALGIFHQAESEDEWGSALDAAVAALGANGRLLVSNFAPGTRREETPFRLVEGTRFVYVGPRRGRLCLRTPEGLDDDLARRGLAPQVPTVQVVRESETMRRVVVNALYGRRP